MCISGPTDYPGVSVNETVNDLGQSALSGSILTEKSVNLAWHDRERNVVVGKASRKFLTDTVHFEPRLEAAADGQLLAVLLGHRLHLTVFIVIPMNISKGATTPRHDRSLTASQGPTTVFSSFLPRFTTRRCSLDRLSQPLGQALYGGCSGLDERGHVGPNYGSVSLTHDTVDPDHVNISRLGRKHHLRVCPI